MTGWRRGEAYLSVEREIRRLAALQAAMVGEVASSLSFLDDSHHSPAAWVQATVNCFRGTATGRVQTAAMLAANPEIAAANAAGTIGADQLRLLTGLHANERARDQLLDSQGLLVGHARELTARDFKQVCQRWLAHADPDGAHRDHDTSRENRKASFAPIGAGFQFRAEGDALTGDTLRQALAAAVELEWQADIAERLARYGDAANQHPLVRTSLQRAFDAFTKLMLQGAGVLHPKSREPLVTIVCSPQVLINAIRDFVGGPDAERVINDDGSERTALCDETYPGDTYLCETLSGQPVDPRDLAVAALLGQVQRVIKDSAGRVIDHGRKYRLFRGAARDAVLLMGDRCCWPGCDQHAGLQIDHMSPWAAMRGATSPTNGAPLCGKHNRAKHNGRITITRDATGWHFFRADGTEIAPRNP